MQWAKLVTMTLDVSRIFIFWRLDVNMWEKISSAATGISAFAAMIAAVVAMKQATNADEQYQIAHGRIFAKYGADAR